MNIPTIIRRSEVILDKQEYLATFNIGKMLANWKFCPICGSELLEVYPGDYFGHTNCWDEAEKCDGVGFNIIVKNVDGSYQTTRPNIGVPNELSMIYNNGHSSATLEADGDLRIIRSYLGDDLVGEVPLYKSEFVKMVGIENARS